MDPGRYHAYWNKSEKQKIMHSEISQKDKFCNHLCVESKK